MSSIRFQSWNSTLDILKKVSSRLKSSNLFRMKPVCFLAITFMAFSLGSSSPVSEPEPICACTKDYRPECGKDGKTYSNKCIRECDQVDLDYEGMCKDVVTPAPTCACPKIYLPECGKDGKTYPNKCVRECDKVEKLGDGECPRVPSGNTCACTKEFAPECGKNGITYPNKCVRECDKVEKATDGPCPDIVMPEPICACTREWAPVCGKDGKTYGNKCALKCAKVEKAHDGECKKPGTGKPFEPKGPTRQPGCSCTKEHVPVCATNGVTYSNACEAKCHGVEPVPEGKPCPVPR